MLKKILIFFLAVFLLTGCKSSQDIEEIIFSSWGSITEVGIIKEIISDYEAENPNIKIRFMHIPQNYFQKIHLLFASRTAPDVVFINNQYLPIYSNYLEDLSGFVNKKDFYPQALDALSYDEKLLAIPRDVSNLVFYINTDLIGKLDSSWSIEDLLQYSQKVKGSNAYGVSYEEELYYLLPYLAYYGESFDKDFDFDKSKGVGFYKALRDEHKVAPTKSQVGSLTLAQLFLDEKLAMYLSGRWMYPIISQRADFNWIVMNFPYGKQGQPCDASGWAISKDSKHKDAALEFINYLASERVAEEFFQTGLIVPARRSEKFFIEDNIHNEKIFLEVLKKSKSFCVDRNFKKYNDKINKEL